MSCRHPIESTKIQRVWESRADEADPDSDNWVRREDRGELLRPVVREDGTLLVEGYVARPGILRYRRKDGSVRRELVTEDLLADASTLGRAHVTLGHPRRDTKVTPQNVQRLGVGDVDGDITITDNGFVRVRMAVRRHDAIRAIRKGRRELSPGYDVRLDRTPGVHPEFGEYDVKQIERRYNHVAIVERARGGSEIRARYDEADDLDEPLDFIGREDSEPARRTSMPEALLRLLGSLGINRRFDTEDEAIEAIAAHLRARTDSIDETVAEAVEAEKAKTAKAIKDLDVERARADAAEAERDAAKDRLEVLEVAEAKRADAASLEELKPVAKAFGIELGDNASVKDVRMQIARAHLGDGMRSDASDAYIEAAVDIAAKAVKSREEGRNRSHRSWGGSGEGSGSRGDGADPARRNDSRPQRRQSMSSRWLQQVNDARSGGGAK